MPFRTYFLVFVLLLAAGRLWASPKDYYGIPADSVATVQQARQTLDSLLRLPHWQGIIAPHTANAIARPHSVHDSTADFYLLVCIALLLGLIRLANTRYFGNLIRAFWNTTLSPRQLKEQLQHAPLPNLLMNIFFIITSGAYIYYIFQLLAPDKVKLHNHAGLMLSLIGCMLVIYGGKYLIMRFSGWAFHVAPITEQYIFNVFLINKIIAIVLLPFMALIAFMPPAWAMPLIMVSLVLVGILLVNRYTRSWGVFHSFFQYSRFHFFTYLCASEILPLAVLLKLLMRGLL